jgi:hypothetical protein
MQPTAEGFGDDPDPGIFFDGVTGERTEIPVPIGNQRMYYVGIGDAIRKRGLAPVPETDALAAMAILEASFDSGRDGRVMPIPLTSEERIRWHATRGSVATD